MRINRYIAQCGLGSRRKCDEYIFKGLIKVNGKIKTDFSYNVKKDDYVQFNNRLIELPDLETYILNKPKGYICTKKDNLKRKIIYDLLPDKSLFSIGRLDYDTSGIILVTNDGDLSYKLTHPKFNVKKKYIVLTDGKLSKNDITMISSGIRIDKKNILKAKISYICKVYSRYEWDIILTEGKNREIKRIFNYFDINVIKLHRYEFAGITLKNTSIGKYRKINKEEKRKLESLF